jgi:MFS family permease
MPSSVGLIESPPVHTRLIHARHPQRAHEWQRNPRGGGLALVFAFRMLGMFMVLPVLATYGMDLAGATPALIGLAIGAYGLTQAILQIPFGMISDRIGRRPVIYLGWWSSPSAVCWRPRPTRSGA